ncbi:MAG: hypothetical protein ACO4AJ_06950 [Prochlorothrix sp.]
MVAAEQVLGLAASALGLLLAGVGVGLQQIQSLERSAQQVEQQVYPLLAQVAIVETAVAEQHRAIEGLWGEHLRSQSQGIPPRAEILARQTQHFWDQGTGIDTGIGTALTLLGKMPTAPPTLQAQWQALERTHQQFQDQSDHILTLVAAGQWQTAQSLDSSLGQELAQVHQALGDLRLVLLEEGQSLAATGAVAQQRVRRIQGTAGAMVLVLGSAIGIGLGQEVQRRSRAAN